MQTVILSSPYARQRAHQLIDKAPDGFVVTVKQPTRTSDQNDKLWAMLSDISRAMPQGRRHTPEVWKALAMHACGHEVQFAEGLDGNPFPIGFRSSRLSKSQMSDLIEFVTEYGTRHGVRWTDEAREAA